MIVRDMLHGFDYGGFLAGGHKTLIGLLDEEFLTQIRNLSEKHVIAA